MVQAPIIDLGTRDFARVWHDAARSGGRAPARRDPRHLAFGRTPARDHGWAAVPTRKSGEPGRHRRSTRSSVAATSPTTSGQLVGYPILLLRETSAICTCTCATWRKRCMRTLAGFGIAADAQARVDRCVGNRRPPPRKLASIGIAVKRWVTLHGFALNVARPICAVRRHQSLRARGRRDGLDVGRARRTVEMDVNGAVRGDLRLRLRAPLLLAAGAGLRSFDSPWGRRGTGTSRPSEQGSEFAATRDAADLPPAEEVPVSRRARVSPRLHLRGSDPGPDVDRS